jgi:hypothetical protein
MPSETPLAFFSYARADSQFALQLAKDLKASGASVWLDQLDIQAGQRWDKAVEDALANCPRLLVILSPASVDSTNVMDEVSFALEERKIVIPVLHQECKIPFRLRRVQYVDFRGDYAAGVRELLSVMGVEARAEAVPVEQGPPPMPPERAPWKVEAPPRLARVEREIVEPVRDPAVAPPKGTQVRGDVLKVMLWMARVLALGVAGLGLFELFASHNPRDRYGLGVFAMGVAQLAAWKGEWQAGVVAIAVGITVPMFTDVSYLGVLVFSIPAILFLLRWTLVRKLQRADSFNVQQQD